MTDPKPTIYVNNLNDRVSLTILNNELLNLFNKYGEIKQIKTGKTMKLKGQAFIVFKSNEDANKAIEGLQNHELFSKPMRIVYAKHNSDLINDKETIKQRKLAKKKEATKPNPKKRKLQDKENQEDKEKKKKKASDTNEWKKLPPNHILLLQNITENSSELDSTFEELEGFINIRFVKVRNLAFIEFENEDCSTKVLKLFESKEELKKFGSDIILSYAKK
ncbi:unnamed protein product [Candida verbasci]|uniref:RRM domain-containing protein n=1 Tax=Candida verbasci TaxID=1227364 RepID=A0A9W4XAY2_9ASCO|nr:unnamed protein product [Candida verbasci]